MSAAAPAGTGSVLTVPAFRRLWVGLGLSSLGDWLGLLALTAMANMLADGYAAQNYAIAGVLLLRVLPAIVRLPKLRTPPPRPLKPIVSGLLPTPLPLVML